MTAIGPGDFVECVTAFVPVPGWRVVPAVPSVGQICRVSWCGPGRRNGKGAMAAGLGLVGYSVFDADDRAGGFDAAHFRPVYKPNASLIRDLMQPVDDGVPA
jgi:hypothetical protein